METCRLITGRNNGIYDVCFDYQIIFVLQSTPLSNNNFFIEIVEIFRNYITNYMYDLCCTNKKLCNHKRTSIVYCKCQKIQINPITDFFFLISIEVCSINNDICLVLYVPMTSAKVCLHE